MRCGLVHRLAITTAAQIANRYAQLKGFKPSEADLIARFSFNVKKSKTLTSQSLHRDSGEPKIAVKQVEFGGSFK